MSRLLLLEVDLAGLVEGDGARESERANLNQLGDFAQTVFQGKEIKKLEVFAAENVPGSKGLATVTGLLVAVALTVRSFGYAIGKIGELIERIGAAFPQEKFEVTLPDGRKIIIVGRKLREKFQELMEETRHTVRDTDLASPAPKEIPIKIRYLYA